MSEDDFSSNIDGNARYNAVKALAAEEGSQDDHEDEHEPGRRRDGEGSEQGCTLGEGRL